MRVRRAGSLAHFGLPMLPLRSLLGVPAMKKSPLQTVKENFESKAALVKAVRDLAGKDLWIDRTSGDGDLEQVSNKKLLHLHEVFSTVKSEFGSRDKVIDRIVELESRAKDKDYRTRFEKWPTPRLLDYVKARQLASKSASAKA